MIVVSIPIKSHFDLPLKYEFQFTDYLINHEFKFTAWNMISIYRLKQDFDLPLETGFRFTA